ncbi:MAG: hypothetical protein AAFZ18_30835, partial [Myxococcota bacterium]
SAHAPPWRQGAKRAGLGITLHFAMMSDSHSWAPDLQGRGRGPKGRFASAHAPPWRQGAKRAGLGITLHFVQR